MIRTKKGKAVFHQEKLSLRTRIRRKFKLFRESVRESGWLFSIVRFLNYYTPFRQLGELYWQIRYRSADTYHIVKTGLKPGYYDIDTRLLHAMFSLLTEFVEKEKPDKHTDWEFDERHRHAWKEITELYSWWRFLRPNRKDPLRDVHSPNMNFVPCKRDEDGDPVLYSMIETCDADSQNRWAKACHESFRTEAMWAEEDEKMMIRLIRVRGFLWT